MTNGAVETGLSPGLAAFEELSEALEEAARTCDDYFYQGRRRASRDELLAETDGAMTTLWHHVRDSGAVTVADMAFREQFTTALKENAIVKVHDIGGMIDRRFGEPSSNAEGVIRDHAEQTSQTRTEPVVLKVSCWMDRHEDDDGVWTRPKAYLTWHQAALRVSELVLNEFYSTVGGHFRYWGEANFDYALTLDWMNHWMETEWAKLRAGVEQERVAFLSAQAAALPARDHWVGPKSPKEWGNEFGATWKTIRRHIDGKKIRAQMVTTRSWRIHRDDIPCKQ